MLPFARLNLPGARHAAEGRRLIANGDGIGAIVRTLATAGDKQEERQDLKLALITALIRQEKKTFMSANKWKSLLKVKLN